MNARVKRVTAAQDAVDCNDGWIVVEVLKKLTRASFTAVGPKVLVLLMTICCARLGVNEGNPGTLAAGMALKTLASSKW